MWKQNGIAAFMARRMLARCASIRRGAILGARDEPQVLAEVQGFIEEMSLALRLNLLPDWCGALAARSLPDLEQCRVQFERLPLAGAPQADHQGDNQSDKLLRVCSEVFAAASSRCASEHAGDRLGREASAASPNDGGGTGSQNRPEQTIPEPSATRH